MPTDDRTTARTEASSRAGKEDGFDEALAAWAQVAEQTPDRALQGPVPATGSDVEAAACLSAARRFHAGIPDGGDLQPPGEDLLPALLQPFRDPQRVRHDYPLFLPPPGDNGAPSRLRPPSDLLAELAEQVGAGPDGARILKDNLSRLERCMRVAIDGQSGPVDAAPTLVEATAAIEQELGLPERSAGELHDGLQKLIEALPARGTLLPLEETTPLHLFLHLACGQVAERHRALRDEARRLAEALRDLLRLDRGQERIGESVGAAGGVHFDPEALGRLLADHGGSALEPARRTRIEGVIQTLRRFVEEEPPQVHVVHAEDVPESCRRSGTQFRQVARSDVCRNAATLFDDMAGGWSQVLGALRIGRLELAGAYEPARHDAFTEAFDWRAFDAAELVSLPLVLAVESAEHLAGAGMLDLSQLMLSGRPVHVLLTVQPATNPGAAPDDPLGAYRFELGYLGVSHRDAVVNQSTASRPEHLLAGFARSLDAGRAALHVVASGLTSGGGPHDIGSWLYGGAAMEGRAHPLFHYNPEAGETWARRLDFAGNPQPEKDWPVYELPVRDAEGELSTMPVAFTFADFALLERVYHDHFRVLPDGFESEALVTLDAYLALTAEDALGRVPYIWAADGRNHLHRLVVTQLLVFACRDRLDYWRTLQELAGIRNAYVREAVETERRRLEDQFAAERGELEQSHQAEIERVRAGAAAEAMRRLAAALVRGDLGAVAGAVAERAPAAPPAPPTGTPSPEAVETGPSPDDAAPDQDDQEVAAEPQDPWIESPLCTSCNDCLDINPRLFVYNENKQAVIGDPGVGTFEELVRAAEKCPARCIHPGTPLNPDEPDLEALIERAKPFNIQV